MIGRVLADRYKVVASIGEGGMSRVWRAQDLNTGKMVAVKVLREEYRDDDLFVRRFEREAQAASRMTHPNIANLLDVGLEDDGTRYLVIEYVSGKTLKQFIQESGAIRPETAAQIIIRVLAALQHAHQNGVIHRDIKPQNILIDKEGTVKVTDFGIARLANTQTMRQDTETVMGSVYYFSPEQARGADVDEKSDIYSVGVMFYEMLTGEVPFTGDTPVSIAMKHLQDDPQKPSELNSAVSPALDFVVLHAMGKRPRQRYASAADMLRDVRLALEHPDTILAARAEAERREHEALSRERRKKRVEKRTRRTRRLLIGLLTLLFLCFTAFAGFRLMERVLLSSRSRIEVPSFINMSLEEGRLLAQELGLEVYRRIDTTRDVVSEGVIYDQSIAPGTFVDSGTIITLIAYKSEHTLSAPNLVGLMVADARNIAEGMGLVVNYQYEASQAAEGMVVSQSPLSGSGMDAGDTIEITVSGGLVTIPDLRGQTVINAYAMINALSLHLKSSPHDVLTDDPSQVGRVIAQDPDPLSRVQSGFGIELWVGVQSSSLYRSDIRVDLSEIKTETEVSISLDEIDGTTSIPYTRVHEKAEANPIVVPVYSREQRSAYYEVFFDGLLVDSGYVEFKTR